MGYSGYGNDSSAEQRAAASFIFYTLPGTGDSLFCALRDGKVHTGRIMGKYEGADIINGDRAGLRNLDGVWKAFGLPYAGSSKIYRNESAPLGAIVLLRQAKDNHLRRLCPVEAFPDLYREITVHRWDRQFVENSTALLLRLLEDIPVYLLECRPDREAVEIVRNEIFGNNAEGKGEA